ncbi:transketolase family protein [Streptomyces rubellomurinus]|uniref:Transketolase family protein n=1 Tax=Streptomyces sp. Y1 TaxID=3238634 RepID=A0AB39TQQ8_9ACTN|nr:transketolase [Streptomyces rubellomurinus subsp. indigoferus]
MDTMRERFVDVTTRLLDEDPRLALVLADITAASFDPAHERHPDRVVNVGIREQLLIGAAGGLALTGMRPIAHTFASFLVERPFEQVKLSLSHQGVGAVLVSAGGSYDNPAAGRTHMAPGDVALLDTLPDWTVHVPGHPEEAERLLRHAYADGDRNVYVRLSAQQNETPVAIEPGRLTAVRTGRGGVVVAVGPVLDAVLAATEGLDATVLYAATVRPFDRAGLRAALDAPSGRGDVVLVEPYLAGTSAHAVHEALADRPHRLLALGVPRAEHRHYGSMAEHLAAYGLDAAGLRERIGTFLW